MGGKEIRFKFHDVDNGGNQTGFLAKKGRFDGETLWLGKHDIPIVAVLRADRRFDRIILTLLQDDGGVGAAAIAVKSRNVKTLLAALNRESSKRWAEIRREKLAEQGKAAEMRLEICPYCEATIDLTNTDRTPQIFCGYCDTIVTLGGHGPKNEREHALCDGCGYFSRPREFSTFYFYFLLFVYGWQHGKRFVCGGCMRKEAWKMLFANLIFVLGVPFALYQLARVYLVDKTGMKSSFAGLDKANLLAQKGKMEEAIKRYVDICTNVSDYAGIRYNAGLALIEKNDAGRAATQFENALALCGNHSPSFEAACACYEQAGQPAQAEELRKKWGADEEEAPPAGSLDDSGVDQTS